MMHHRKAQSIFGMLLMGTLASGVMAQQDTTVGQLPPLPMPAPVDTNPAPTAPAGPGVPAMPGMPQQPAPLAPPASSVTTPNGSTMPTMPLPAPADPNTPENTSGLPSVPTPSSSSSPTSLSTMLNGITRNSSNPETTEATKVYSYGSSSLSILFLPTQIDKMKQAIRTYENSAKTAATTFAAPEPVAVTAPTVTISEPGSYPVFYLASIAYDAPGKWSLWISGHKITSRKNATDLTVLNVGPQSVTFSWSPTYFTAISQRQSQKQFAPLDPVKNRLQQSQPINLDTTNNNVTFTLKANQSFVVGYFTIFEGYVPSPKLPPLAGVTPPAVTQGDAGTLGQPLAGATSDATLPPGTLLPANPLNPGASANGQKLPATSPQPGATVKVPPAPNTNPRIPAQPAGMPALPQQPNR